MRDLLLLSLFLLLATSTEASGTLGQFSTLPIFSELEVVPLAELGGESEDDDDVSDDEDWPLVASCFWYIFARQGLIRFPDMAKKMDDSLEAKLR